MTRPIRRAPKQQPVTVRRPFPAPQPLRLPNGYYDPDSAAFDAADARPANDMGELLRSTTPLEALLRPVRS